MNQQDYEIYQTMAGPEPPVKLPDPNKHKSTFHGSFLKGFLVGMAATLVIGFTLWGTATIAGRIFGKAGRSADMAVGGWNSDSADSVLEEDTANKISEIRMLLSRYYLFDYTDEDLQEGIIKGMVDSLGDPYTVYYNEEETKELTLSNTGQYSGIGAVLSQDLNTMYITITRIYKNAPAGEAGLQKGDVLYKIDGEDITGQELSTVVTRIRGEEGTHVDMTVIRDGKEVSVTVTRRKIEVETVEYKMLENQVGYISISAFEEVTLDQFREALSELQGQGMQSVVFDLRDNPGGLLNICCEMLDELLPQGLLVYTEDKQGKTTEYNSTGDDTWDLPVVILVNGNSASASEIFTGALKDRLGAIVVGETTYGKGIVQSILDLGDGTTLKVTISEYFTPNGTEIHKIGITPDHEVRDDEESEDGETVDKPLEKALEILGADR